MLRHPQQRNPDTEGLSKEAFRILLRSAAPQSSPFQLLITREPRPEGCEYLIRPRARAFDLPVEEWTFVTMDAEGFLFHCRFESQRPQFVLCRFGCGAGHPRLVNASIERDGGDRGRRPLEFVEPLTDASGRLMRRRLRPNCLGSRRGSRHRESVGGSTDHEEVVAVDGSGGGIRIHDIDRADAA